MHVYAYAKLTGVARIIVRCYGKNGCGEFRGFASYTHCLFMIVICVDVFCCFFFTHFFFFLFFLSLYTKGGASVSGDTIRFHSL